MDINVNIPELAQRLFYICSHPVRSSQYKVTQLNIQTEYDTTQKEDATVFNNML